MSFTKSHTFQKVVQVLKRYPVLKKDLSGVEKDRCLENLRVNFKMAVALNTPQEVIGKIKAV